MPDLIFRSEYLAEFVAAAASMFNLEGERDDGRTWNAVVEGLHAPEGWVTLGVDLAKKEDFTVICGCNTETRMPSVYERFNEISWAIQQDLILEQVAALEADPAVEGVTVVVDSTGVGEVVHDNLEDAGLDVVPVNFGSGNIKERMVRLLAADFEHGRAFIPEAMRDEHEHYEYEISPLGRFKFAAPDGEHDDKVSAKMLENWGCVHEAPAGIQAYMPALDDEPLEDDGLDMPPDEEEAAELLPDDPSDIMERTMPRAAPERY